MSAASGLRIGITGGPGTGKSTVLGLLRDAGFSVVSADVVARELVQGELRPMIGEVTGLGAEFSAEQLRGYVLSGPDHRRRLNAALHAPIWAAMAKTGALFWEVPLLVEAGLTDWFDEVWLVTCGEAAQVERLRARGLSEGETVRLIGSQMRLSAKRVFCDAVIRTDPPFEHVRAITLELARTSLRRLAPPQQ